MRSSSDAIFASVFAVVALVESNSKVEFRFGCRSLESEFGLPTTYAVNNSNRKLLCLRVHDVVFAKQVGSPVDEVEEGEHFGKEDARDDVDTFASRGELV